MNPIENGESGLSVRQKLNALIEPTGWTRPQAVAAFAGGFVPQNGQVYAIGAMFYQGQTGATGIPDLPGLVPFGPAYPDHYAENTVPGTTDMRAALELAMNTGIAALRATTYFISNTVEIYARNGVVLRGESQENSRLLFGTGNGTNNWLVFYTRQFTDRWLSCQGVVLQDFTMDTNDGTKTGGYFIYFEQRGERCKIENLRFLNAPNGMRASALALSEIRGCKWQGRTKNATRGYALHFYSDETVGIWDNTSPIGRAAKPTDVHVTDCQINPGAGGQFEIAVYIEAADGIYFDNCHFRGATEVVVFNAQTLPCRSVVASTSWANCYFDGVIGSHVVFRGVGNGTLWTAPGDGGVQSDVRYRAHRFDSCQFREAGNPTTGAASLASIRADMTSGYVDWVQITDCIIRDNRRSGVYAPSGSSGLRHTVITGNLFIRNNDPSASTGGANAASHGDIWISGGGHLIEGNQFVGGGANGNAVRIGGGTERSLISNNLMDQSLTTTKISRGDTSVSIRGNIGFTLRAKGSVTITSPETTAVVTHGLSFSPEAGDIFLTMRGNGTPVARMWVSAIGATTFQINLDVAPTSPLTIDWQSNSERL